ncbi:MAG TPA: toll/interleukin-1 receptor domain-containing protein [Methyloceanibacter sp.]|nr:toll/interleukin-1 receptor domain-containing protein [Methyloceanibacter sp.]
MAASGTNPKIVLSYRRTDAAMAGRIFDRLVQHFGKSSLFIDIDNVPFGVDFRKHIDDALKTSDLLIAVVGRNWVGAQSDGKARIMNEADPVRVELETALRRDLNVLPVLLDGASMPDPGDLPESIRDFAYRNAVEVESGRDFNVHIDRLIRAIEQLLGVKAKVEPPPVSPLLSQAPPATRKTRPKLWATALLGVGALAVAGLLWFGGIPWPTDKEDAPEGLPPFCLELGKVLFHAETQFTSILGPERSGVWTARIQLPGWNDCTIRDWTFEGKTTRYYSCELPPYTNLTDALAVQNNLATYVKPCLGPDYTERRSQYSDQTTDVTYERGQDDAIVRLRISRYSGSEQYIMRLDVDAPQPPAVPGQ